MTITGNQHPLFNAQLDLEEEMRSLGIKKFREQIEIAQKKGQESRTLAVRRIMGNAHQDMVEAVEAFVATASSGKAGPKHSALKFIKLVGDNDIVAHIAMRAVLDGVSQRERLTHCAIKLATMLEDEVHFETFKEQLPVAYKAMHKNAEKSPDARHRRNAMLMPARKMGAKFEDWSPRDKLLIGTKLIELFVETTGLAQITRMSEGTANTQIYVEATPATLEWIEGENAHLEWLSPVYLPTIIPAKDWTSAFSGGYWSGRVRRLTLVKTKNREYLEELSERDMPMVYGAINALQNTAWQVNTKVMDVMEGLWAVGSPLAKLPTQQTTLQSLPERPHWLTKEMKTDEMTEGQLAIFRSWKQECTRVYDEVGTSKSKRMAFTRMLGVARMMRRYDEFFFPHQLDWRGRVYPVSLYLTPQGNDAQRGILEFANTVPLTNDEGVEWLAIHGAGLWGVDKVDMEARVQWVKDNEAAILASASDPYENRFWADAEKPWQALAFCFEWLGWKTEGYAFESSLPVQMDGTCNGLQNFSAILRDEIGGAAVNLVPSDKPQDIYTRVSDVVAKKVEADLFSTEIVKLKRKNEDGETVEVDGPSIASLARGWHGHINRKVTKRPVMTLAYGARRFGFIEQVFEDTVGPWKSEHPETFPFEGSGWQAADYMGKLIWDAVQEVVVAAAQAMDWLQAAARVAAKNGLPVMWTTPVGFVVQQAYRLPNQKRIEMTFEQVRLRLTINLDEAKIDSRKQASGISPNWVHSLDAAHMKRTIHLCHEMGVRSFSFIHDSYGTHAGNAAVLARVLREAFVAQYEDDVLAKFRDDLLGQLPDGAELPDLPAKGTLDLDLVLESPFFFA